MLVCYQSARKTLTKHTLDELTAIAESKRLHFNDLLGVLGLFTLRLSSLFEMADSSARVTTFTPDRSGVYAAQLVVSDGELDSEPCAIQIQAFTVQTEAIAALQGLEAGIAALDSGVFKNGGMQNLLLNKLHALGFFMALWLNLFWLRHSRARH